MTKRHHERTYFNDPVDNKTYVKGSPRVVKKSEVDLFCPNCGCETLFDIEVTIEGHPLIPKGRGTYVGCPACPFASPMLAMRTEDTDVSGPTKQ